MSTALPQSPNICFEGWAMKAGNSSGRCCCNCKYQKIATGHPWNKKNWLKFPITTAVAYACTMPDMERITLFDFKHSMCEMHEWKELDGIHPSSVNADLAR